MRAMAFGATCALCLATAAHAQGDPASSDRLYLPLDGANTAAIVNVPTNSQMEREYPKVALAMSLAGSMTMTCTDELDGHLDDCRIDSESPEGLGFGAAGLRLAAYFSAKPATFDGHPVKSRITIPIRFQMGGGSPLPPPPPIPPPTSPQALRLAREVVALDGDAERLTAQGAAAAARFTTQSVASGDAVAGERFADAYRLGLRDAIAEEVDQRVRLMAGTMTADQLRATLDFLRTPAGGAYRQALARTEDPQHSSIWRRAMDAAKVHLCDRGACPSQAAAVASAPGS